MTGSDRGLVIDGLTIRYGAGASQTTAVRDLSLSVGDGEVLALLGPSGCGKSTLLRAIAGLETPATGTIAWNGNDLRHLPPHQRDLGLMFQDHALFAHRSVEQNISFGPRMRGASRAEQQRRTAELLTLVGLDGFAERRVHSLSGGEAQRVALARALAPNPALLLLDEPLGALDRSLRDQLVTELRTVLRSLNQTTLHVTHDQDEAFAIADRIAIMDAGELRRIGAPAEVWNDPQSHFVAGFLGHPVSVIDGVDYAIAPGTAQLIDDRGTVANTMANQSTVTLDGVVMDQRFQGDRFEYRIRTTIGEVTTFGRESRAVGAETVVAIPHAAMNPLTRP